MIVESLASYHILTAMWQTYIVGWRKSCMRLQEVQGEARLSQDYLHHAVHV